MILVCSKVAFSFIFYQDWILTNVHNLTALFCY
jgi:hypothetical protein